MSGITEAWEISSRINIYLLDSLSEESLADQPSTKGRTVGETFAHMHNVRLMWLQVSAPQIPVTGKIEKGNITSSLLRDALNDSEKAISTLLESAAASGKIKGFKKSPEAFLGYLIAHESHHRGQILLALKNHRHLPDKKILYGMWEWGVR